MPAATLFVPGILRNPRENAPAEPRRYPVLETLLARAERSHRTYTESTSFEETLCALFGIERNPPYDLPIGALSALSDLDAEEQGIWARADPVHLRADLGKLRLLGLQDLALDQHSALRFCAEINQHLAADQGLQFVVGKHPGRWYVRIPDRVPELRTHAPAIALGQHIDPYLPSGADASRWMRLANEIQMLLHDSPTNLEREALGLPSVNSLWFWGFGQRPNITETPWQKMLCDDPLAQGLGIAGGLKVSSPSLEAITGVHAGNMVAQVLVLPFPIDALLNRPDYAAWQSHLENLEHRWLTPLMRALETRQLSALNLMTENACYALRRPHLYRIWRYRRPISHY